MLRFTGVIGSSFVMIELFDDKTITVLREANEWSRVARLTVDVNAIDNGSHGVNTFHGRSLAWDLDVVGEDAQDLVSLASYLQMRLPPPYEVVLESTHVHIEFDTHKGG